MEKDVTAGEGSVRNSSGRTVGASVWGGSSTWVAGDVQREKKEEEGKNGGGGSEDWRVSKRWWWWVTRATISGCAWQAFSSGCALPVSIARGARCCRTQRVAGVRAAFAAPAID